jgi:hypothetical protein
MSDGRLVPQSDDELLDAFADLLSEIVPEDPEEIDALVVQAGLDPVEVEAEAAQFISKVRATSPLDWRNRHRQMEEMDRRHDLAASDLPRDRGGLLERLQELVAHPLMKGAHAHYRGHKPEELTDEELRSLINDLEFVLEEGRRAPADEDKG